MMPTKITQPSQATSFPDGARGGAERAAACGTAGRECCTSAMTNSDLVDHRYGRGEGRTTAACTAVRAVPATSEPIATPRMKLSPAVYHLEPRSSWVTNGATFATTVTSVITQPKKRMGFGV